MGRVLLHWLTNLIAQWLVLFSSSVAAILITPKLPSWYSRAKLWFASASKTSKWNKTDEIVSVALQRQDQGMLVSALFKVQDDIAGLGGCFEMLVMVLLISAVEVVYFSQVLAQGASATPTLAEWFELVGNYPLLAIAIVGIRRKSNQRQQQFAALEASIMASP